MTSARPAGRLDLALGLVLLAAGAGIVGGLLEGTARRGVPIVHDECAYLLQARMLASGHLSLPSPPLPEFFETPHVLLVPRFAAKYFPGHAALLAPFVLFSVPWLGPALLFGATAAVLFLALRLSRIGRWPALVPPLFWLGNADAAGAFAGYLSQSTSTFLCVGAVAAVAALWRRPTAARAALLGGCAGWAGLARPFTGLALALAGAAFLAGLGLARRPRLALAFAAPLAAAALVGLVVSHEVTGAWTQSPWSLYARQYVPSDGPGFGPVAATPALRALPAHLAPLGEQTTASRQAYTAARAFAGIPRRLALVSSAFPLAALVLASAGLFALTPPFAFALLGGVLDFALLLGFHAVSAQYLVELQPLLLFIAGAGAAQALDRAAQLRGRLLRLSAAVGCGLLALWILVSSQDALRERFRAADSSGLRQHRFDDALAKVAAVRGLVFLRYPPGWEVDQDLTCNQPDLRRAALVRAIDLGDRNAELARVFADRPAFVLDLGKGELSFWAPQPPAAR